MRELKFRAWDLKWKHWFPLDSDDSFCLFNDEQFTIEQFTGLKDKNGREIYEGDILMAPEGSCYHNGDRFKVEWRGLCFAFIGINNRPDLKDGCSFDTITNGKITKEDGLEVIGNIHENPELLTPSPTGGKE